MKLPVIARTMRKYLSRLTRDERGVSAVEFAVLLPFMLTLYLGGVEVTQAVATDRKVTMVARVVSDLASQTNTIANSDMTDILNAAASVVAPYSAASLRVIVSSVAIDAQGNAKVVWSDAYNTTARAKDQVVSLPTALKTPNTTIIWGEVSYSYRPAIGYVLTGTLNLSDQIYMRPRFAACVTRVTASGSVC